MGSKGKFVVAAVVALGLVLSGPAAWAAPAGGHGHDRPPPAPTELVVTGSFTGTGTLGSEPCVRFHQVVQGSGDWTELGLSTFLLDFCLGFDPTGGTNDPIDNATFTITAADGGTLTGGMTGTVDPSGFGPDFPLHFVLDITAGTGRFAGATGSIAMDGAFGFGAATVHGTVDGTVTLPPPRPASWRDCLRGGWRNLVDDQGRPFPSAAHCIVFALRHPSG
jgi:hypothetical protein